MIRIALTGSIGMGKSTVAAMFARAGISVFDADAEVRRLQGPGGALLATIGAAFPGAKAGGELDRERLAAIVLADPAQLRKLEAIVHPAVAAAREAFIAANRDAPALLFDIPLLFETQGEAAFDKVIVVSAPTEVQRARVLQRPGMTAAKARLDPGPADARFRQARPRRLHHRYRHRLIHYRGPGRRDNRLSGARAGRIIAGDARDHLRH